jgi:murein DD-endopeptidase MepM/ murein hydrolase activator NlpD
MTVAAIFVLAGSGCTPLPPAGKGCTRTTTRPSGKGVRHTVRRGETLWRISKAYGVAVAEIQDANGLESTTIRVGQKLVIPGASTVKRVAPSTTGSTRRTGTEKPGPNAAKLSWPLAGRGRSSITSGFGQRTDPVYGGGEFHKGVDIDGAREERVLAAAPGEVVFAGKMSGFGTVVMIDHGGRLITVYAHLSRAVVKLEDMVERGKVIGYVGSSGKATGTHLHFEVRYKGVSVDPLEYLP